MQIIVNLNAFNKNADISIMKDANNYVAIPEVSYDNLGKTIFKELENSREEKNKIFISSDISEYSQNIANTLRTIIKTQYSNKNIEIEVIE